jgi:putative intracellular protease/amidase
MRHRVTIVIVIALIFSAGVSVCYGQRSKVLLVVAPTRNHPSEYAVTRSALVAANCDVKVACKEPTAKDMNGKRIPVDMTFGQVHPEDFDAVAIIGGYSVWKYVGDPEVEKLIHRFADAGAYLGAICAGTYVLGKAGLLKGKKVTGPNRRKLRRYGATYVGGLVQQDGTVITAKGPVSSKAFGKSLAEAVRKPFRTRY